ncbi:MAG: GNAT family N-acetyltransferase [archaeon]
MEIREAKIEEVEEILKLNQQLFDYEFENFDKTLDCNWSPKNKGYFEKAIKGKNSITLVAVLDGKIIGYLVGGIHKAGNYRKIEKLVEVENTFILEEQRGKGVGEKLFKMFLEWAKKKKVKRMKVVASAKNKRAINFYKKCGFLDYDSILERNI